MEVVYSPQMAPMVAHRPYLDPGLRGEIASLFSSADGRFHAVYWQTAGPGELLEQPRTDEWICILEGGAEVEWHGERCQAGPGDVIFWGHVDPPRIIVPERLLAFCVSYDGNRGPLPEPGEEVSSE